MKTLIVYCTRTGLTKEIANFTAKELDAQLVEITNGKDRSGFWGYIAAAFEGLSAKLPKLLPVQYPESLSDYDRVVVAAPVWCEDVSPILRAFLAENKEQITGDVHVILTHMSNIGYEKKIDALKGYLGKEVKSFVSVQTKNHDWTNEIKEFTDSLR